MARRAARQDANHAPIVAALRAKGASVLDLSAVGRGCPDLLVGWRGHNWLIECKDGAKAPSRRKLTEAQEDFRATWRGHWARVESAEQAIEVLK